jgi:hypothetical protein
VDILAGSLLPHFLEEFFHSFQSVTRGTKISQLCPDNPASSLVEFPFQEGSYCMRKCLSKESGVTEYNSTCS